MRIIKRKSKPPIGHNRLRSGAWTIIALLLVLGTAGCSKDDVIGRPSESLGKENWTIPQQLAELQGVRGAETVPVVELTTSTIREELRVTGELIPEESAVVKPLMDGRIQFLRELKIGDMVHEGELIAKIDDRDIEFEIDYQQKQIKISSETLKLNMESLEQQKRETAFDRELVAEGLLTKNELEKSELTLKQRENDLEKSRIQLEQEQNRLKKNLREREKVPIIAPISGMVVAADHLKGNTSTVGLLSEDIMEIDDKLVSSSTELFGIISQKGFQARCLVNGKDKARISDGMPVTATVHSHQEIVVRGSVIKVAHLQDSKSHAYKIWIKLDEIDPSFTSGLFVSCEIELERNDGALVIEKKYVKERSGESFVQIVEDDMVKNVFVETGLKQGLLIELVSGVKAGDLVIARETELTADQAVKAEKVEPELDEGRS